MPDHHDRGYKALFSNQRFMEQLVTSFIHEDWVAHVDFSRASLVDKSYVTRQFKKLESDLIWKLPLTDEGTVYLYLLIEFQSSVDHWMAYRMLRYVLEFYGGLLKAKPKPERLPAVFPLLVYNGDPRWTAPEQFATLVDQRIAADYIPHFRYYKLAANEFAPDQLEAMHNLASALFLVDSSTVDEIQRRIRGIVSILEKEQPEVVTEFIRWLYAHFEDPVPQWVDEIRTLKEVPTMLATAIKKKEQEWFKEGLTLGEERGRIEGRNEGRLEGRIEERRETARRMKARGIEIDIIAEVTGLSRQEIEEL